MAARERAGRIDAGAAIGVRNGLAADRVAAIAPVDVVGERLRLFGARVERVVEAGVAERGVEIDGLPFVDRRRRRRHGERRLDVAHDDRERLGVAAAIVVVDRDRDGVGAIVGVGVRAAERAGGWNAGAAVRVGDAHAGDRVASVTPVDVVGERLGLFGARIERVVEARIGERAEIRQRKQRAFVDRLIAVRERERRRIVRDRDRELLDEAAAIIVVDGDRDRVRAVVGVGVAAVERAGRIDEPGRRSCRRRSCR